MKLTAREIALISVGAAVAANCHPCLENHSRKALDAGLSTQDILDATEVAKSVRTGAGNHMDRLIKTLHGNSAAQSADCGCGCS